MAAKKIHKNKKEFRWGLGIFLAGQNNNPCNAISNKLIEKRLAKKKRTTAFLKNATNEIIENPQMTSSFPLQQ